MSTLQLPSSHPDAPSQTTPLLPRPSSSKERLSRLTQTASSAPAALSADRPKMFLPLMDPAMRDYLIGVIFLLCVVLMWSISSFITSDLFDAGYNKSFLVTYVNTSAFSLYLLPSLYKRYRTKPSPSRTTSSQYSALPPTTGSTHSHHRRRSNSSNMRSGEGRSVSPMATLHPPLTSSSVRVIDDNPVERLSERETAKLAVLFCGFWFAANWSVNKSLEWTSVGSSTILASMSGFFTLGIGRVFNVESFTRSKLIAVSISFFGVLLVSLADSLGITASLPPSPPLPDIPSIPSISSFASDSPASSTITAMLPLPMPSPNLRFYGDALALLSAFFYALYVVLLKVRIGEESRIDMQLFFGFVGLWNVILLWPIGLMLHLMGWETMELPTGTAWWTIGINMLITLVSDILFLLAMLKTTPLVVTVGLSLTIPFAVFGDLFRGTGSGGWQALVGAGLVLASFGFMGVEGAKEVEEEEEENEDPESEEGEERRERGYGALVEEEEEEDDGEERRRCERRERERGSERVQPSGQAGRDAAAVVGVERVQRGRSRTDDGGLGIV